MSRKIVAIGGGENGRQLSDGTNAPYETYLMDKEIVDLVQKEKVNFLFLGHAQPIHIQESYFHTMEKIYGDMLGCECKILKSNELDDIEKVKNLIAWADIIYEGGGDTLNMMQEWRNAKFDKVLENAWNDGKVVCGVSAGGVCWFHSCNSDSLIIENGQSEELTSVDCLNFINAYCVPHCDEKGRYDSAKKELKKNGLVGILLSNCAAIEIVDDSYRVIFTDASHHKIEPYAKKAFWMDGNYYEYDIRNEKEFMPLSDLLKKE
ncbi:MAG: Type 1 glutamine amidotransferase-like domain-containing protein [Clostridia bacterium]|nr:Type 1 glutamine amidotransferase-like domain-containing protein [Clostridia bacterium]